RALHRSGLHVTASHRLLREYREYERLATTVVNAYVGPLMAAHLRRLGSAARGGLRVMQSNGGLVGGPTAAAEPVRTVLSGPAGGVAGASDHARRAGFDRVVTLDMGGTSTDVSLVDGAAAYRSETTVAGMPVRVPAVDIHTVGAGGGSLARIDAGGALRVGPESAGADPGPACYGSGTRPTVTDANLVLGRLVETEFLGGGMRLDTARARRALASIARGLGRSVEAAAAGVVAVVTAAMERALRVITVERGHDPRDLLLVAFGGARGRPGTVAGHAARVRATPSGPALGLGRALRGGHARRQSHAPARGAGAHRAGARLSRSRGTAAPRARPRRRRPAASRAPARRALRRPVVRGERAIRRRLAARLSRPPSPPLRTRGVRSPARGGDAPGPRPRRPAAPAARSTIARRRRPSGAAAGVLRRPRLVGVGAPSRGAGRRAAAARSGGGLRIQRHDARSTRLAPDRRRAGRPGARGPRCVSWIRWRSRSPTIAWPRSRRRWASCSDARRCRRT